MGFKSVYKGLLEVFPQVDPRILRAVAIEHPKDVDVAVLVVLSEVLPCFSSQRRLRDSSSSQGQSLLDPSGDVQVSISADGTYSTGANYGMPEELKLEQMQSTKSGVLSKPEYDMSCSNSNTVALEVGANEGLDMSCLNSDTLVLKDGADEGRDMSCLNSDALVLKDGVNKGCDQVCGDDLSRIFHQTKLGDHLLVDSKGVVYSSVQEEETCLDDIQPELHGSATHIAPTAVQNIFPHSPESSHSVSEPVTKAEEPKAGAPSPIVSGRKLSSWEMVEFENETWMSPVSTPEEFVNVETEANGSLVAAYEEELLASEMDVPDDETSMKANVITQSIPECTSELLEEIIENEKAEKIALRSAKNSLLGLINEVERKEKSLEQAREEAAQGGLDTYARVADLKQMLQLAKEANDMQAGEVYGEKAILGTEMKELRSRLLSMSEERINTIAIIDEMQQELQLRLVLAEEEIEKAGREKLEKEESAQKLLAQEESSMEKVVEEAKILEQQAKQNTKLREFLMDHGHLVDMLQGEISVICQDVKFMKSKFDQRIPSSKYLSSSQTNSISTFSSSSVVSASSEQVADPEVVVTSTKQEAVLLNSADELEVHKNLKTCELEVQQRHGLNQNHKSDKSVALVADRKKLDGKRIQKEKYGALMADRKKLDGKRIIIEGEENEAGDYDVNGEIYTPEELEAFYGPSTFLTRRFKKLDLEKRKGKGFKKGYRAKITKHSKKDPEHYNMTNTLNSPRRMKHSLLNEFWADDDGFCDV